MGPWAGNSCGLTLRDCSRAAASSKQTRRQSSVGLNLGAMAPQSYYCTSGRCVFQQCSQWNPRSVIAILTTRSHSTFLQQERSMPAMTMTEQILAKHSGKKSVQPGENIWVDVDVLMTHDI